MPNVQFPLPLHSLPTEFMPSNLELRIKVGELTSFSAVTDVLKCYETVELGGKDNSCIKNTI